MRVGRNYCVLVFVLLNWLLLAIDHTRAFALPGTIGNYKLLLLPLLWFVLVVHLDINDLLHLFPLLLHTELVAKLTADIAPCTLGPTGSSGPLRSSGGYPGLDSCSFLVCNRGGGVGLVVFRPLSLAGLALL
jgi:hypothetical protein